MAINSAFCVFFQSGDEGDFNSFEITAVPVEFGKSGSKSFFTNGAGLHSTTQNRPATGEKQAEEYYKWLWEE